MQSIVIMNRIMRYIEAIFLLLFGLTAALSAQDINIAAKRGDLDLVKNLLAADSTLLELKDQAGNTPLINACYAVPERVPHKELVKYLIDRGADINAKNKRGATPLYFAVKDIELTQYLIANGASVNVSAYGGYTPIMQAALSGNIALADLLTKNGAELNSKGQRGTILHYLITSKKEGSEEMLKYLFERGANFQEFSYGNTELHLAVLQGTNEMVKTLLELGIDVNIENDYGRTALYYAAKHGYKTKTDLLITSGVNEKSISEYNFGASRHVTEKIQEGEANIWYLGGNTSPYAGYAIKTANNLLFFNPTDLKNSPEAGLANGYLNPGELSGQNITMLITFNKYYGQKGSKIAEYAEQLPGTRFVTNFRPDSLEKSTNNNSLTVVSENKTYTIEGLKVHTIPAMRKAWFGGEGVGYLVEVDGLKIFYPGLHAPARNKPELLKKYFKEIDFLKPFGPIDIVILPVTGRHVRFQYEPYHYLIEQLSPKAIYLIGDDLAYEEHSKCLSILNKTNVPVYYPEGGIAAGESFYFKNNK